MSADVRTELEKLIAGAQQAANVPNPPKPEAILRVLVDASPLAMLVANDSGTFVLANRAAAELTGYSLAELTGLSVWQLTPDVHEREAETLWRAFLQQREQLGTYRLLLKEGTTIVTNYAARTNVLRGFHVSVLGR